MCKPGEQPGSSLERKESAQLNAVGHGTFGSNTSLNMRYTDQKCEGGKAFKNARKFKP